MNEYKENLNKSKRKKILFLSADAGTGHNMAAGALVSAFSRIDSAVECKIVNCYSLLSQFTRLMMEDAYIYMIQWFPGLYGYFYEKKTENPSIGGLKNWLENSSVRKLKNFIEKEDPDAVICTHAFPCGVLAKVRKRFGLRSKIVGVITDFVVNPFWLYPETDLYLLAHENLRDIMESGGIAGDRIKVTGIPIDSHFQLNGVTKENLRSNLGIDPQVPTLIIMGGGLGMKPVTRSLKILERVSISLQAILAMGKNSRDRKKLEHAAKKFDNSRVSVRILGYVDNISDYMKASDLILTKPGGMTASESMAAGLPMLIASPIPGPETYNSAFLTGKGFAKMVKNEQDLPAEIENLFTDRDDLQKMSKAALNSAKPEAAYLAAQEIYSRLG